MQQKIIQAEDNYAQLDEWIRVSVRKCLFLVCGGSIQKMKIHKYFEELSTRSGIKVVRFSAFSPNPTYDSVEEGVKAFVQSGADGIIAVGGGSAMDVAKCIKLYSNLNPDECYLDQAIMPNEIRFLAVPTTAGTGSEATKYAVIYYKGVKQSVTHESCIPDTVLMDAEALKPLPDYHRKAAMLDALCHAVESFWSINSTDESRGYAFEAIRLILANMDSYLANDNEGNANMLKAAHIAGKAINITQTTAGHAMCYKLTSLYGIAHGHAAALCVRELWPWMLGHMDQCADGRGREYLEQTFCNLATAMGCGDPRTAAGKFSALIEKLELSVPVLKEGDFAMLRVSVNPVRLKNSPVTLDEEAIDYLYRKTGRRH